MDALAFAQQIARTQHFTLGVPRAFTISADGERVLFLRSRGGEDPVGCLWLLAEGSERLLVDPLMVSQDEELPEAERIRRERAREHGSGVVAYSADAAAQVVVFALAGQLWLTQVGDGQARPLPAAPGAVDPRLDPTGRRVAYVSDGALHVITLADGTDLVLAAPEGPQVSYGLAEHVAAESMGRQRGFWWAPDGEQLLAARVDNSPVRRWWISDPANPESPPREIRYPAAGTANAEVSLHVLGLDGARVEIGWDRVALEYLVTAGWDARGPLLSVQSRDQQTLRILAADAGTGRTTVLHEERDPAWVQLTPGAPLRTGSGALVRVSDLAGSRRLVVDGKPVTADGVQVREVLGADGGSVLFAASEEPTQEHLWRYDPDGGAVQLSHQPGVHSGRAAAGTLVLISRTESGHAITVSRPGRPAAAIASLDAEPMVLPRITWLSAGAREIRTALLLPSWYSSGSGPLPVLMSPYSGPAAQLVLRVRHGWFCDAQWFAEAGFAVVIADGRGTPGRGPAWEKEVYGDSLTAVLQDQVDALHAVAAQRGDLDLGKVGIRGWSYGGTLAAAAVIDRPDVFHTAISGAGPSDQRLYDTHWRERFLGHPDQQPENYARSSPITRAASLRRPLLLMHGLADDNVVVAHTLRMSAALLAAGRPHRVLPLPGTHVPGEVAMIRLLGFELDFLRETLGLSADGGCP